MEFLEHLALGFNTAMDPSLLALCFAGVLLGTLVGVLPGLGPVSTIALLLPFTFSMSPTAAMITLAGIYYGAQYGGSITAILVNLPGEASSAVDVHRWLRDGARGARRHGVGRCSSRFFPRRHHGHAAARRVSDSVGGGGGALRSRGLRCSDGVRPRRGDRARPRQPLEGDRDGHGGLAARSHWPRHRVWPAAIHVRDSRAVRRHRFRAAGHRIVRSCGDHGRIGRARERRGRGQLGVHCEPSPRRSAARGGRSVRGTLARLRCSVRCPVAAPFSRRSRRTHSRRRCPRATRRSEPEPSPAWPDRSPPTTRRRRHPSFRC